MAHHDRLASCPFHFMQGPQFVRRSFQPGGGGGPLQAFMAAAVFLKARLQGAEQALLLGGR
jgi:hypothetical protein